jgi:hypothetical protein
MNVLEKSSPYLEVRRQCAKKVYLMVRFYRLRLLATLWGDELISELQKIREDVNQIRSTEASAKIERRISILTDKIRKLIGWNIGFKELQITNERVIQGKPWREMEQTTVYGVWYRAIDRITENESSKQEARDLSVDKWWYNDIFDINSSRITKFEKITPVRRKKI